MTQFLAHLTVLAACLSLVNAAAFPRNNNQDWKDRKVLILGGGVAGVIAARTLKQNGIENFFIIEARDELGGRLKGTTIGNGKKWHIEEGANWIQGTETPGGLTNPIFTLARKHNLKSQASDFFGSITTYDFTGEVNYTDLFNKAVDDYATLTVSAGPRVTRQLVDTTARTGYSLTGIRPRSHQEKACEYYAFDWEYAQTPEQTSWIASSWANNFTFDPEQGGFSEDNVLSIDPRGFQTVIEAEAKEFLRPEQIILNSIVQSIAYTASGVKVTLTNGKTISGDYAICTFSVGVLQYGDVKFDPELPEWKREAIQSMTMATYTKIFLQFPKKFWFDTEFGLYADLERGKYPVWQSLDTEGFLPGSGIIFATVTGDYSERVEVLSDNQVKSEVMTVLRSMFPNQTVPEPIDFHFPRWFTNPFYRGSYSNWPSSFFAEHHDNLRATVNSRLWFAGEHTSQKWFGFLHGAYFEGLDIGGKVAKCIRGGGCVGLQHFEDVTNSRPYSVGSL